MKSSVKQIDVIKYEEAMRASVEKTLLSELGWEADNEKLEFAVYNTFLNFRSALYPLIKKAIKGRWTAIQVKSFYPDFKEVSVSIKIPPFEQHLQDKLSTIQT